MKIEAQAKEVIHYLARLQGDFARFREDFGLVGKHLGHAHVTYQTAEKRLDQFGEKLITADGDTAELLEPASNDRNSG
jgi:DNA anti-recombination protein RmuC